MCNMLIGQGGKLLLTLQELVLSDQNEIISNLKRLRENVSYIFF